MNPILRVKICCISSIQEAQLTVQCGASAIGLVGPMPSGPGIISNEKIKAIAATIPPPIATFLLSAETSVKKIIEHHELVHTSTIQLVDALQEGSYEELKIALPSTKIVQVIHVQDARSVKEAITLSDKVDALLLDSGNPNLTIKELGGTGRVHNWELSRQIRAAVKVPVFLAGGLNAANINEAIQKVRPFGVDVCSGVRTNGQLDPIKLKAFFKKLRN